MADEDEIIVDVTGQIGGPHPDEQAMVDAEQLELVTRMRAARASEDAEERRRMNEKIERAIAAQSELRSFAARLKALEDKVR